MFFLKDHKQNVVGKLVPEPFIKSKIMHISESTVRNVIQLVFMVCPSGGLQKYTVESP